MIRITLERIKRAEQAIDTLNKNCEKIEAFLEINKPRKGHSKTGKEVKSNITDNESAKMKTNNGTIQGYNGVATVDKKHQIVIDAQAFGSGQEQHTLYVSGASIDSLVQYEMSLNEARIPT